MSSHESALFELPMAPLQRLIKQALPPSASISKDVKQALGKAAALFILYLTHTANEQCRNTGRSMVSPDDVLAAVEEIEFDMFLDPLHEYLKEFKTAQADKKKKPKASAGGDETSAPASGSGTAGKKRSRAKAANGSAAEESEGKKTKLDAAQTQLASATTAPTTDASSHVEEEDEHLADAEDEE